MLKCRSDLATAKPAPRGDSHRRASCSNSQALAGTIQKALRETPQKHEIQNQNRSERVLHLQSIGRWGEWSVESPHQPIPFVCFVDTSDWMRR